MKGQFFKTSKQTGQLDFCKFCHCSESENVSGEEVNTWEAEPTPAEPAEEPKDSKEAEFV